MGQKSFAYREYAFGTSSSETKEARGVPKLRVFELLDSFVFIAYTYLGVALKSFSIHIDKIREKAR